MEINNKYYFPEEISINILSRLPTLSVISCSFVCKSWRNLILYNRDFARTHLLRGLESHHHDHGASSAYYYNGRLNFLLLTDLGYNKGCQLYYTLDDYDYDDDNYEKLETRLRVLRSNPNPYNKKNYYVVGSCNGLICMAYDIGSNDRDYDDFEQPMYICNPITREWLTLPSLTIDDCCYCSTNDDDDDDDDRLNKLFLQVVCGFGYLPSTDEYKVVRIYNCDGGQSCVGHVQVYTLGDGTGWRDKGEITYKLEYYMNAPAILANGSLHWVEHDEGKIVAFDLADEEFILLPSPPCFIPYEDDEYPFRIQVLGGQLCAFHPKENLTVGMWFFKNEKEEKNGNYKDGNGRLECQSWCWTKEYDIELTDDLEVGDLNPFILTKQGDVLYLSRCKRLFCYEFKTATSKELMRMEDLLHDFYYFEAIIPHLNSFISLKALGEEDTKIIIESAN